MYNYKDAMHNDIRQHIKETIECHPLTVNEILHDTDGLFDRLYDEYFICDGITGNASGSYTFNSYTAKEYVTDNSDLLREALTEFCDTPENITEHFLNDDYEYFDVTIRCYLLGEILAEEIETFHNAYTAALENLLSTFDDTKRELFDVMTSDMIATFEEDKHQLDIAREIKAADVEVIENYKEEYLTA